MQRLFSGMQILFNQVWTEVKGIRK